MPKKSERCTHCGNFTSGQVYAGNAWRVLCPKCTDEWWSLRDEKVREAFIDFTASSRLTKR